MIYCIIHLVICMVQVEAALGNPFQAVAGGIPVGATLLGITAAHETGHQIAGRLRKAKIGLPFLIPS